MQVMVVNGDVESLANMLNSAIADSYGKGQQFERERIRARAKIAAEKVWRAGDWYIGPQHFMLEQFVDALVDVLEDGDATTV